MQKGQTYKIKWDATNVTSVYIKLRKGSDTYQGSESSIGSVQNTNFIDWTVPTTLPDGSDYSVRVISSNNTQIYDDSDNYFTIYYGTGCPLNLIPPNNLKGEITSYYQQGKYAGDVALGWVR